MYLSIMYTVKNVIYRNSLYHTSSHVAMLCSFNQDAWRKIYLVAWFVYYASFNTFPYILHYLLWQLSKWETVYCTCVKKGIIKDHHALAHSDQTQITLTTVQLKICNVMPTSNQQVKGSILVLLLTSTQAPTGSFIYVLGVL